MVKTSNKNFVDDISKSNEYLKNISITIMSH